MLTYNEYIVYNVYFIIFQWYILYIRLLSIFLVGFTLNNCEREYVLYCIMHTTRIKNEATKIYGMYSETKNINKIK